MTASPSPWLLRHRDAVRQASTRGPVLDVACGRGRHAVALAREGLPVVGVDRNAEFMDALGDAAPGAVRRVRADLETGHGLPFAAGRFGVVLVFRYLHRPLCPALADLLAPGGLLLYETFTREQRRFGTGPRRDDFLLASGELPTLFPGLTRLDFEEHVTAGEAPAALASLAAQRPG